VGKEASKKVGSFRLFLTSADGGERGDYEGKKGRGGNRPARRKLGCALRVAESGSVTAKRGQMQGKNPKGQKSKKEKSQLWHLDKRGEESREIPTLRSL